MNDLMKMIFASGLAVGSIPLFGQEPWDPHLKITAAIMPSAVESLIGQTKLYGVALAGAYPLSVHGAGVIEGGYKFFIPTSRHFGMSTVDDNSNNYFRGAMYRYELWRNGVYVQAGARATNAITTRKTFYNNEGWDKVKADRKAAAGWCAGAGYRLTHQWSVEIGASSATFLNVDGQTKTGIMIEAALVIHR
jgi:hypothetical protein